jgi:hypothetical protein
MQQQKEKLEFNKPVRHLINQVTTDLVPISYTKALVSTLLHAIV